MVCSHPVVKQRGKIKTSVLAWLSIAIGSSGITLRFTLPVQTENQAPGGGGGSTGDNSLLRSCSFSLQKSCYCGLKAFYRLSVKPHICGCSLVPANVALPPLGEEHGESVLQEQTEPLTQ